MFPYPCCPGGPSGRERRGGVKEGEEEEEGEKEATAIWTKSARDIVEKSKEEEYDEYFKDMLL